MVLVTFPSFELLFLFLRRTLRSHLVCCEPHRFPRDEEYDSFFHLFKTWSSVVFSFYKGKSKTKKGSSSGTSNWETFDEKDLACEDELILEKKRQLLEQQLQDMKGGQSTAAASLRDSSPAGKKQRSQSHHISPTKKGAGLAAHAISFCFLFY